MNQKEKISGTFISLQLLPPQNQDSCVSLSQTGDAMLSIYAIASRVDCGQRTFGDKILGGDTDRASPLMHEMKQRIVHTVQKFLLNPPIKLALAMRLPLPGYALLETKGRKTGKPRCTPVGDGHIGNEFWLVAEHGMKAGYVRNIERDPHVRLKLREGLRYRWYRGTANLLPADDPRERQRWLAKELPSSAANAKAVRLFGTQLLSIRIDLYR